MSSGSYSNAKTFFSVVIDIHFLSETCHIEYRTALDERFMKESTFFKKKLLIISITDN